MYFYQTFFLTKSLDCEQCTVSSARSSAREEREPGGWASVTECVNSGLWLPRAPLLVCVLPRWFSSKREAARSLYEKAGWQHNFSVALNLSVFRYNGMSKDRLLLNIEVEKDAFILTRVTAIAQVNIQAVETPVSPARQVNITTITCYRHIKNVREPCHK